MRRNQIFPLLVLGGSTLIFVPLARAQSAGQVLGRALGQFFSVQNETASEAQLRSFDHFLQNHPDAARELRRRPERVNNPEFVNRHPALRDWLNNHREAANVFRENPDQFMDQERHFQYYDQDFVSGNTRRGELAHFDWFLDSHPAIRRDLMRRPELVQRHRYLNDHPDLRAFLDRHPIVRDELMNHPRDFMRREARLENRQNENQHENR